MVNKKKKKYRKPSDWPSYWGSSKFLQEDVAKEGEANFTREIVRLCQNRSECSYYETKMIFETDAILRPQYYNDWCTVKVSSIHVKNLKYTE